MNFGGMECIFAIDLELSRADGLIMCNGGFYLHFGTLVLQQALSSAGTCFGMALFIMVFSIPIKHRLGLQGLGGRI